MPDPKLDLSKIIQFSFPDTQYYREEHAKTQVVLHHTVSGPDANRVFEVWKSNTERVATAICISGDGTIVQGFSTKYWAHHLGLKSVNNTVLNQKSIGIELCNWGGLLLKQGQYYSIYNKPVPASEVISYPKGFRGYQHFHKYTSLQIESLRQLLVYLCEKYAIKPDYQDDMWDVSTNALNGNNGIYTHVSYRKDKSDLHPQPELIAMLRALKKISLAGGVN